VLKMMLLAGAVAAGSANEPKDVYFAYFVRVTALKIEAINATGQPTYRIVRINEGPMSLTEGMQRAHQIEREGICLVIPPSVDPPSSGSATCYPSNRIQLVEVK
jgi:hypothetical protein